jgi:aminopeptidase YwaD
MDQPLRLAIAAHLEILARTHPDRHVGGPGNAAANDHAEGVLRGCGFEVSSDEFDCLDWLPGSARLTAGTRNWTLHPGPYSMPCAAAAPLAAAARVEELEAGRFAGTVLVLHGDLAREQLLPKSFRWLDLPEHRRVIGLLEAQRPVAVIAATGRGSGFSGSLYPFPVIEDGEVDLPSAYLTDIEGAQVLAHVGEHVEVVIESRRSPARARQLTATRGPRGAPRVVIFAHIDSKSGSPGAVDNATGVAALLGLAELLRGYAGPYRLELVPLNGEDQYANPGEHLYLAQNEGRWADVALGVNLDGIGGRGAATAVSTYGCPERLDSLVAEVIGRHPGVVPGDAWYESDHSLFLLQDRPAVALTSADFRELMVSVTHSARDTLEVVDAARVTEAARFLADLVPSLPPLE